MESITNAAAEVLVDALSFNLLGSGQYIQERRSVTFLPEGSNAYSAQAGTRVIRFKLATKGWLDSGTVRIFVRCGQRRPNRQQSFKTHRPNPCFLPSPPHYHARCSYRRHKRLRFSSWFVRYPLHLAGSEERAGGGFRIRPPGARTRNTRATPRNPQISDGMHQTAGENLTWGKVYPIKILSLKNVVRLNWHRRTNHQWYLWPLRRN